MITLEKNNRTTAIICHIHALIDGRERPAIHGQADLAAMDATSLLEELEMLFNEMHPSNSACMVLLNDLRDSLKQ